MPCDMNLRVDVFFHCIPADDDVPQQVARIDAITETIKNVSAQLIQAGAMGTGASSSRRQPVKTVRKKGKTK